MMNEIKCGKTIVDIYRTAKQLLSMPNVNNDSVQNAVNVARWIKLIPVLNCTPYGAARLVWQHKGNYLEMVFLNGVVKIVFCAAGQFENLYTAEQHFKEKILIDMLYTEIIKFATMSGLEVPGLKLWDEFEGVKIEDINMEIVEKREKIAYETMIDTYHTLQFKEVTEDVTVRDETDKETTDTDIVEQK